MYKHDDALQVRRRNPWPSTPELQIQGRLRVLGGIYKWTAVACVISRGGNQAAEVCYEELPLITVLLQKHGLPRTAHHNSKT